MRLVTETTNETSTILIVSKGEKLFTNLLRKELKKHNAEVFFSAKKPHNYSRFEHVFFINEEVVPQKNQNIKRLTLIFINRDSQAKKVAFTLKKKGIKVISVVGYDIDSNHIDKLLWFVFSKTTEIFLQVISIKKEKIPSTIHKINSSFFPKKKTFFIIIFIVFLVSHLVFIPPLMLSMFLTYKSLGALKENNLLQTERYVNLGRPLFILSKNLFLIPRSTFLFFSFSLPQRMVTLQEKSLAIITTTTGLEKNLKRLVQLFLQKGKNADEKLQIEIRLIKVKEDINNLRENLIALEPVIPALVDSSQKIRQNIKENINLLTHLRSIFAYSDFLFAKNTKRTYLLLFANNMELRPGGGFIGSYGILNIEDYTLKSLKVYDVYDADGQLNAHIEPPDAIRNHLNQPNWFLRDSAFSPDFLENYIQAKFFLEKEMDLKEFSGSILLTTTAVQNVLRSYGDIYLADFDEYVNDKNFYLKAQYYSESNFFPGSIQKKNFLGSLASNLLINIDSSSQMNLVQEIKKSLDDKQIVLYFDHQKLQQVVDTLYWSGRAIEASCAKENSNCIADYIFPYEANLGVNKANFFVSRLFDLSVTVDNKGLIENTLSIQIKNDSPSQTFPGGTYKNYFQMLLPSSAQIKKITKDGVLVEDFDQSKDQYKKIGFLLQIQPKSIAEIKITYSLDSPLQSGKNIYQLIFQKQIGLANSDLTIRLKLDRNIHLVTKNFPALVKDQEIIYNTSLSADKIYLLELAKE